MLEQIAGYFEPYGEAEATAGIRRHVEMFWTPAMAEQARTALRDGLFDVSPIARRALLGDPE